VVERIVRDGTSPSTPEIGRALKISDARVKQLVAQLIQEGALERTYGAHRGLRVRDMAQSRYELAEALRRLGWSTSEPMASLSSTFPNRQVPLLPPFEHLPDID